MINSLTDLPSFGVVDQMAEHGILSVKKGGPCLLTLVRRTEGGYPRKELAVIPLSTWKAISSVVQRELVRVMERVEIGRVAPSFRGGDQALSPLITRELAVLFWSLMEDGEGTHVQVLLSGWRDLAREERWWLYSRASNPGQKLGHGWRRALFFGFTDPTDTRNVLASNKFMESASNPSQKSSSGRSIPVTIEKVRNQEKNDASKDSAGTALESFQVSQIDLF